LHGNHLPSPSLRKVFELGIGRAMRLSLFARRQPLSCFSLMSLRSICNISNASLG
jgi:hypothetical protein